MYAVRQAVSTRDRTWTSSALPVERQSMLTDLIERSHLRCAALGMSRRQRPDFKALMRTDLTVARERNRRLLTRAAPVMEMLFEHIANTESMIVLSDTQGTILHAVGDDGFLERARKVALKPGANWAEHSMGTNAVGTALIEEAPTCVHGDQHFLRANGFLSSSAAPIIDPRGSMIGVLDVTGDQHAHHQHTMGLVRMSARMIENHCLCADFGDRLRLHFHSRAEFIDTLLEGILVVAPDGAIIASNRSALDQLDMSGAALRMQTLASLFGMTASGVFDHLRGPLPPPMCLRLPNGKQFHASARFNGTTRTFMCASNEQAVASPVVEERAIPGTQALAITGEEGPSDRLSALQKLRTGAPQIDSVVQKLQRVLNKDIPLLVLGETGTGKELLARAVHHDSNRSKQPFVAVNCASIPESLIEAELFGYEDGAFTGARRKGATGRIVQANRGTLFLDEIGDMPLAFQARLLRVLQERCVTPLGSHKSIDVDMAVIGATHRNLREMIEAGTFREDLYYRLNGLVVKLPALRERSDLGVIVRRILQSGCQQATPQISPVVMELFERYGWPGNIRQLANVLRTAAVMAAGEPHITEQHLSDDFLEDARRLRSEPCADPLGPTAQIAKSSSASTVTCVRVPSMESAAPTPANRTLGEAGVELIRSTLEAAGGNIAEASKRLGISRNTIYRKLRWGNKPA